MYKQMTEIENQRCQSDKLYDCIVNTESDHLNLLCSHIYKMVSRRWKEQMSTRMKNILEMTVASDDRVAKHALLFFALYQEPEMYTLFINKTPCVPPAKFTPFVQQELPVVVGKLLRGSFTSLRAFVEDTRWTYTTL